MTTALFHLRTVQLGISLSELDLLTIGMVNDMYAEAANDKDGEYARLATPCQVLWCHRQFQW